MEIDYFKKEISSSGKLYFRNTVTNETQWGFKTYYNTDKKLPRGWVRLNVNQKPLYKYDKPVLPSSYSYSYAPKELEIFQMSYEYLQNDEEEEQQAEAYRRYNLFRKVASILKLRTDSICDESLEFLAVKAKVPVERIITYIKETETKELGKRAILTPFSTIKRTDISFLSERSIRELCGVNTKEVEVQNAFSQIQHQFTCPLSLYPFIDPVTCSSGHTFERSYVTQLIRSINPVCPLSRLRLTGLIGPNHALKKVIDQFIEKYINQKGEHWAPILEFCVAYIESFTGRLQAPTDVGVLDESDSDDADSDSDESDTDESDSDESDTEQQYRDMRERQIQRGIEEDQTGRSEEEIRAYMIYYGNLHEADIPEFIAQSSNSSYTHAIRESSLRYNQLGRTSEQIRAYMINANGGEDIGVDLPAAAREFIQGIPDYIAGSTQSSYRNSDFELNRRQTELQRNARFYGL